MHTKESPIPEHVQTPEEKETVMRYKALLLDGWMPTGGNHWVSDPHKKGYFLIIMQKGDQIEELQSTIALPIVNLPES